jgi:hydroxymethylpyrimidine pyrophosphatase-like HAD family hydrolase
MRKEVEVYITKNYYELLSIAKKITKGNQLSQELLHECIIQLYDKNDIVLQKYTDNQIKYYIVAVMRTNWFSNTSPFYYRIRRESAKYVDLKEVMEMEADQESFEKEQLLVILEEQFCDLNWFHKSLLELYMTLGSLSKVSKQTGIPLTSVSNYIKQSKAEIKLKITEQLKK